MTTRKKDMIAIIVYSSLLILAIMILFLVDLHDELAKYIIAPELRIVR